jgi:rfaE bifunctional protein kinase chain/domain
MASDKYVRILRRFAGKRITVLGDFLLDQYILGNSSRVSREAPIVVVDYQETVNHPGGAANASQNIAALGAGAAAVGVVGNDREGDDLIELLTRAGVETAGLVRYKEFSTPVKLRIMAGELNAQKQQVARVDRSQRLGPDAGLFEDLGETLERAVAGSDAVLVSDYAVGLVPGRLSERAISAARDRGIPVVVDSRFNLTGYPGATVTTPNEVEAMEALGIREDLDADPMETGRRLIEKSGMEGVVITRGSKGMVVCESSGTAETVGIVGTNEATDVTGAGDTVSAVIALSLACGAPLLDAARMATYAAAVVVMKRGTATASAGEIERIIASHDV